MASVIAAVTGAVALALQIRATRGPEEPPTSRRLPFALVACAVLALGGAAPEPGPVRAVVTPPGTAIDHPAEGAFLSTCSHARGNAENAPGEWIWLISRNPDGTPYFAKQIDVPGPWYSRIQLGE